MDNYDFDGRPISAGAAFLQALKQDPSLKADPSADAEDDDYHGPEPTYGNECW